MTRKVGIYFLIAVVILAAAGGFYRYSRNSKPVSTNNVKYMKVTVEKGSITVGIQATGTAFTPVSKDIISTDSGPLTLNYKLGDTVKQGDLIAKIIDDDLQAQITKLQLNIQSQNLDLAKIKPDDTTAIAQKNLSIAQTQADLKAKQAQLSRTSIFSSISGTVIAQNYSSGDTVQNAKTIITVTDLTQFQLDVSVDELDISKVKLGQKADIKFGALPDRSFEGQVVRISDLGKTTNNITTYDVYVSINNPTGIKPGMNANVNISLANKDNVLLLPLEALQSKNGKDFVYVASANESGSDATNSKTVKRSEVALGETVEVKQIKIGLSNETAAEITEGLAEGQEVYIPVPQIDTSTNSNNLKGLKNTLDKQTTNKPAATPKNTKTKNN